MHKICSLAYERLQRLLRKCQGHLCCSKRVWNEDGECVTLRWEVITGSSKAADYVNFTGHSLLGHYIFYPLRLCDTLTLGNECKSVLSSNVHEELWCSETTASTMQPDGSGMLLHVLGVAGTITLSLSPGRLSLHVFMCGVMTVCTLQVVHLANSIASFSSAWSVSDPEQFTVLMR